MKSTASVITSRHQIVLNLSSLVTHQVAHVRVRSVPDGLWSTVSSGWVVASDCNFNTQYLSTLGTFGQWKCTQCPTGATCEGATVTWREVQPLFGWWRNDLWTEGRPSNFTQCPFPPACLGASNVFFKNQYIAFFTNVIINGSSTKPLLVKELFFLPLFLESYTKL